MKTANPINHKEQFFDELVENVAVKISQSNILPMEVAEKIRKDERLINAVIDKLDPQQLANAFATYIVHALDKGSLNSVSAGTTMKILKDARERAAQMIAEETILG